MDLIQQSQSQIIDIFVLDENLNKFLLVDKNYFEYLISCIYSNQLLTLFSFTFFTTLYCCIMKNKKKIYNKYVVVEQNEPVKGEIV